MNTSRKTSFVAILACAFTVSATCAASVNLTIGEGSANIGNTAEVAVNLTGGGTAVSALVVALRYDPAKLAPFEQYYEFTQTDVTGQPLRDNLGNLITTTSSVRPGAAVQSVDRLFQSETHEEGVLAVAIWGDTRAVPEGTLMTVAFRVLSGAAQNEVLPVAGVVRAAPVTVTVTEGGAPEAIYSSAAGGDAVASAEVAFTEGAVRVGCTPAAAVANVAASQDRPEAVEVTWSAVSGAEYRVYRSAQADAGEALPLGDQWIRDTSFLDMTAPAAVQTSAGGCFGGARYEPVPQYYWVMTRTIDYQCESNLTGAPVQGWRSVAEDQASGTCGGGKADIRTARGGPGAAMPHTPAEAGNVALTGGLALGFVLGGIRMRRRSTH